MDTEQNNKKKSIIEKLPIEKIKIFFIWLFTIAILIGGLFLLTIIYKYNGIVDVFIIVFSCSFFFSFLTFYPIWSNRKRRIFTLLAILICVALGCYAHFSFPTPEEIFSRTMEQINKNKQ